MWQQASDVCRKQLLGIATQETETETETEKGTGRTTIGADWTGLACWQPLSILGCQFMRSRGARQATSRRFASGPKALSNVTRWQWCDLDLQMACGGKQSVHKSSAPIDRSANDQRERAQIAREGPRWGNGIEGTAARLCGMLWRGYCVHWCIDWWRLNRQSNARYTFASIDPSAMWVDRIGFVTTTTTTTTTCQLGWHLHSCASCRPLDRLTDCLTALAGRPASNPTPLSIVSLAVITPWRGSVTLTYVLSRLVLSCLGEARRCNAVLHWRRDWIFYAKWRWQFACQSLDKCCQLWSDSMTDHVDHD